MKNTVKQAPRSHALDRAVIISMAQHVIEYARTLDPAGSDPSKVSTHSSADSLSFGTSHDDSASVGSIPRGVVSHFAEVLLDNAIKRGRDLAECGYMFVRDAQLGGVVARKDSGEFVGVKGAIIEQLGGPIVVDLETPVIRRVITASSKRPLGDFVCVLCELVCVLGSYLRFDRNTVGLLREVVGQLRCAVAEYTKQQPSAPSNPTDNHSNQR